MESLRRESSNKAKERKGIRFSPTGNAGGVSPLRILAEFTLNLPRLLEFISLYDLIVAFSDYGHSRMRRTRSVEGAGVHCEAVGCSCSGHRPSSEGSLGGISSGARTIAHATSHN